MEQACVSCGALNAPGTEFCGQCGVFLAWEPDAAPPGSPDGRVDPPVGRGAGAPPPGLGAASAPTRAAPAGPTPAGPARAGAGSALGSSPGPVLLEAAPTSHADEQDTVTVDAQDDEAPSGDGPETCPACRLVNEPGRRFCAHCGFGFASSVPAQPVAASAWTRLSQAEQDRAARRAYRRSLPPFYRWRRVLVGGALAVVVVAGAVVVRHPVVAVRDAWYALDGRYVRVTPVMASVAPAAATAPGSDAAALVDGTDREWTQTWVPTGTSACGAAPGTAEVVLTFAPTRVRQLQVWPGLAKSNPGRLLQPVPQRIGVTFPGQACRSIDLDPASTLPFDVDSGVAVASVRLGVAAVRPSGTADAALTSITEVIVRAFPR